LNERVIKPSTRSTRSGKAIWIVLGIVLLILVGIGFAGFGLYKAASKANAEATKFASDSMEAIAHPWKAEELWNRSNEAYKKVVTTEQTEKLVALLSDKLGDLKSVDPFSPTSISMNNVNGASTTTVVCEATAHFEKGDGKVTMTTVANDGKWGLQALDVKSPLLESKAEPSAEPSATPETSASPEADH
jgi:hypothetical protein